MPNIIKKLQLLKMSNIIKPQPLLYVAYVLIFLITPSIVNGINVYINSPVDGAYGLESNSYIDRDNVKVHHIIPDITMNSKTVDRYEVYDNSVLLSSGSIDQRWDEEWIFTVPGLHNITVKVYKEDAYVDEDAVLAGLLFDFFDVYDIDYEEKPIELQTVFEERDAALAGKSMLDFEEEMNNIQIKKSFIHLNAKHKGTGEIRQFTMVRLAYNAGSKIKELGFYELFPEEINKREVFSTKEFAEAERGIIFKPLSTEELEILYLIPKFIIKDDLKKMKTIPFITLKPKPKYAFYGYVAAALAALVLIKMYFFSLRKVRKIKVA